MKDTMRMMLNLMIHPVAELEEQKYKKTWNGKLSLVILALWFIATVFQRQLTDFKFNYNNTEKINILYIIGSTWILFLCWTVINWSITTLLDGKGTMKEIWVACSYALVPYIAFTFLQVLLSRYMILEESVFISTLSSIGMIWSVLLLMAALKVIHDYTLVKTIFSIVLSIAGILFVIFLLVLFFGLIQQVILFFQTIYVEIMLRR